MGVKISENGGESSQKLAFAPENPEFSCLKIIILTQATPSRDEYKTGFLLAPVDTKHFNKVSTTDLSISDNDGLQDLQSANVVSDNCVKLSAPASYDLRTLSKVTSVKDQGSAGACWTFAIYSSLESNLLPGENRDISESNLKNLLSSSYPECFESLSVLRAPFSVFQHHLPQEELHRKWHSMRGV